MKCCQHMHGYVGRLESVLNSINIVDTGNRKANFLKQEVKNHVKIATLTVVDFIKESISVSVKFTLKLQSLKSPIGFNIVIQAKFGGYVKLI